MRIAIMVDAKQTAAADSIHYFEIMDCHPMRPCSWASWRALVCLGSCACACFRCTSAVLGSFLFWWGMGCLRLCVGNSWTIFEGYLKGIGMESRPNMVLFTRTWETTLGHKKKEKNLGDLNPPVCVWLWRGLGGSGRCLGDTFWGVALTDS